jgi:hypothetical protein
MGRFLLLLCAAAAAAAATELQLLRRVRDPVPGSYIVKLKPCDAATYQRHVNNVSTTAGCALRREYSFLAAHGFAAYSANLTAAALQSMLARDDVAFVEQNGKATLPPQPPVPPPPRPPPGTSSSWTAGRQPLRCGESQDNPHNWGISRISAQKNWSGSWFPSASNPNPDYEYDGAVGTTVYAYVLDTGIQCSNPDFAAERCLPTQSFVEGESGEGDFQGHGTHCASILGGIAYGVAKRVVLQPVRVMSMYGTGSYEDIMAGMDWAAAQHPGSPGILSLSIGGSVSETLNAAVAAVVASGRLLVAAAGNDGWD